MDDVTIHYWYSLYIWTWFSINSIALLRKRYRALHSSSLYNIPFILDFSSISLSMRILTWERLFNAKIGILYSAILFKPIYFFKAMLFLKLKKFYPVDGWLKVPPDLG